MIDKKISREVLNSLNQLSFWRRWSVLVLIYMLSAFFMVNNIVEPKIHKMQTLTNQISFHQSQMYLLKNRVFELKNYQWQYQLLMLNEFFRDSCQINLNENVIFSELNQVAQRQHLTILKADPLPLNHYHWSFQGSYSQFYSWLKAIDNLPPIILLKACHMVVAMGDNDLSDELIIDVTIEVLPWSSQSCRYF